MDQRSFYRRWFPAIFSVFEPSDNGTWKISPGYRLLNVGLHGLAGVFFIVTAVLAAIAYGYFTPVTIEGKAFSLACALVGIPISLVVLKIIIDCVDDGTAAKIRRAIDYFGLTTPPSPGTLIVLTCGVLFSTAVSTGAAAVIYSEIKEMMHRLGICFGMHNDNTTAVTIGELDRHDDADVVVWIYDWRSLYDVATSCFCYFSPVEELLASGRTEVVVSFVIILYTLCLIPFVIIVISEGLVLRLMHGNGINYDRTKNIRTIDIKKLKRLMQGDYEEALRNLHNFLDAEQQLQNTPVNTEGQST